MCNKKRNSCCCINFRRVSNNMTKYYDDYIKDSGVTLNQFSLIKNIEKIQPACISDIAKKVKLERTTVVRNLKPLFKEEIIKDISSEGSRDKNIVITTKGEDILKKANPLWEEAQKNIKYKLGNENYDNLMKAFDLLEDLWR